MAQAQLPRTGHGGLQIGAGKWSPPDFGGRPELAGGDVDGGNDSVAALRDTRLTWRHLPGQAFDLFLEMVSSNNGRAPPLQFKDADSASHEAAAKSCISACALVDR